MKKILLPAVFAASTIFGAAGLANAAGSGHGVRVYPPNTTTTTTEKEKSSPPVVTVPPSSVSLPVTGADSSNTLAMSAIAVGVGGGLVLVARSRRRRPAQPTV